MRTRARDGHVGRDRAKVRRPIEVLLIEVHSAAHVRRRAEAIAEKHHLSDRTLVFDEKYAP